VVLVLFEARLQTETHLKVVGELLHGSASHSLGDSASSSSYHKSAPIHIYPFHALTMYLSALKFWNASLAYAPLSLTYSYQPMLLFRSHFMPFANFFRSYSSWKY
jgi:hypothetical protein